MIHCLTLKLGIVRGLVGDGVEDLVDFGVEIWLLEAPFTVWRKTEGLIVLILKLFFFS